MTVWEIILIGVALSFDAFAVSVADGMAMSKVKKRYAFIIALVFGVFQAAMPAAGYTLVSLSGKAGGAVYDAFQLYDHWVAMGILCLLGAKMIIEGIKSKVSPECRETAYSKSASEALHRGEEKTEGTEQGTRGAPSLTPLTLLVQGAATSIDALAAGIGLAAAGTGIAWPAFIIGITTTLICLPAVYLGKRAERILGKRATAVGGAVLAAIGIKIGVMG